MVFVKFHNMSRKINFSYVTFKLKQTQTFFTLLVKTILQSQFTNVQFSFLLFSIYVLSILLKMSVLSFFFFYMLCSTMFKLFSFFFFFVHFHCPVAFCFCFVFHFLKFFFHHKLLIQCPFFSPLYLPLCLYLNTITIGSLPRFSISVYSTIN